MGKNSVTKCSFDRLYYLDNIAGLLMLHIIVLHTGTYVIQNFKDSYWFVFPSVTFYAMPWFFFKSGMFYKNTPPTLKIIRICKRYLLYLALSVLFWLVVYKTYGRDYPWIQSFKQFLLNGSVFNNIALWFFPTYISTIVIAYKFKLCSTSNKYLTLSLVFIVPFSLFLVDVNIPWYLANTFEGLFYYIVGYHLKDIQYDRKVLCVSLMTIMIYMIHPSWVSMPDNQLVYGNYLLGYAGSIAGIIITNNLFRSLPNVKFLEFFGKNSLPIFALHVNIVLFFHIVLSIFQLSKAFEFLLITIITIFLLLLIIKIYNRLVIRYDKFVK